MSDMEEQKLEGQTTVAEAASGGDAGSEEAELQQQIQADLDRFRDLAMRTQADFDNFRKRAAREREEAVRYANVSLLERLIPILDNFELGLDAARGEGGGSAIFSGMEMVSRQLQEFLASHGVETVDAVGKAFDPNLHEALAQEESVQVPEGHVVRQLRRGYKLKDRLIRPANVIVSKGAPAA